MIYYFIQIKQANKQSQTQVQERSQSQVQEQVQTQTREQKHEATQTEHHLPEKRYWSDTKLSRFQEDIKQAFKK